MYNTSAKCRVIVQGAVDTEIRSLIRKMPGGNENILNGYYFYETTHPETGSDIIISRTGMGIMNACIATQLGIAHYSPRFIINQGTAGGHTRKMRVGDIVIGDTAVYINDALRELEGENDISPFCASRQLLDEARGTVLHGRLGSGDIYSRGPGTIDELHAKYGELCEDMESAAVYKTCDIFKVPVIGIRIISNNELTGEPEDFDGAHALLQDYIYDYLTRLYRQLPS